MIKEIYNKSTYPYFIRQLARKFITEVVGTRNFIGVHWRFNFDDYITLSENDTIVEDMMQFGLKLKWKTNYCLKRIPIDMCKKIVISTANPKFAIRL